MCILGTLIGLRYIIVHQLIDRPNDLRSGIRTVITEYSPRRIARLLTHLTHWLFPLEVATACATLLAMSAVTLAAPVAAALYGVLALSYWRSKQAFSPLSHGIFREFYYFLWPVCLAGALVLRNPLFTPVLLLAAALGYRIAAGSLRGFTFMKKIGMKTAGDFRISSPLAGQVRRHRPEFVKSDPYPYYADLRARGAVHKIAWSNLGPTFLITRHKTALAIFKDPRFVKDVRNIATPDGSTRTRPGPTRGFGPDMLELDPPDHTRLRKLVSKAFTSRVVDQLQLRVEKSANEILDRAISKGEMEFVSEFASTISIRVISQILGLRIVNIDSFRRFAYALSLSQAKQKTILNLEVTKAQFTKQMTGFLERRRREPQDDLVSALVHAEQDGDRLSSEELLGMVYFLLLAGFVTTQNLMGNAATPLGRTPRGGRGRADGEDQRACGRFSRESGADRLARYPCG